LEFDFGFNIVDAFGFWPEMELVKGYMSAECKNVWFVGVYICGLSKNAHA
jgi:hypothetical protein